MSAILPNPKKRDEKTDELIEQYLKKGGKITTCPPFKRSENIEYSGNFYTKRNLKKEDEENEQ